MIRYKTFSRNILAEKKKRDIGNCKAQEICKKYIDVLVSKGEFQKSIEGPIRYIQGNKDLLESEEPIHHTFRLWILSEALVSMAYFIPIYKGIDILRFKMDVLVRSADMLDELDYNCYIGSTEALNDLLRINYDNVDYDYLLNTVSLIHHYIVGLAIKNRTDVDELRRGANTIIRHLGNK